MAPYNTSQPPPSLLLFSVRCVRQGQSFSATFARRTVFQATPFVPRKCNRSLIISLSLGHKKWQLAASQSSLASSSRIEVYARYKPRCNDTHRCDAASVNKSARRSFAELIKRMSRDLVHRHAGRRSFVLGQVRGGGGACSGTRGKKRIKN